MVYFYKEKNHFWEKIMENKQVLIGAIRACASRSDLDSTFELFKVDNTQQKYDVLVEAMYSPEMFFSSGEPSIAQKFELAVEMFLTMTWKVSELYSKMGIN